MKVSSNGQMSKVSMVQQMVLRERNNPVSVFTKLFDILLPIKDCIEIFHHIFNAIDGNLKRFVMPVWTLCCLVIIKSSNVIY